TRGRALGFDEDGRLRLSPGGRWQMSVYRETPQSGSALSSIWVRGEGTAFVRDERRRKPGEGLLAGAFTRVRGAVADPTEHITFVTPASRPHLGHTQPVWSDLSYAEADLHVPERERRVGVIAMRALEDREGRFVGVLRAGLRRETVDRI